MEGNESTLSDTCNLMSVATFHLLDLVEFCECLDAVNVERTSTDGLEERFFAAIVTESQGIKLTETWKNRFI